MKHRKYLSTLYNGYRSNGHAVFTVTLSTYVTSETFAKSPKMLNFPSNAFIRRIQKHLPFKLRSKIDYDFIVEKDKDGNYHFHGFLVVPNSAAHYIYNNGLLNKHIERDINCLSNAGKYRPLKVNKYLIEPAKNIYMWATYITKTPDYIH